MVAYILKHINKFVVIAFLISLVVTYLLRTNGYI